MPTVARRVVVWFASLMLLACVACGGGGGGSSGGSSSGGTGGDTSGGGTGGDTSGGGTGGDTPGGSTGGDTGGGTTAQGEPSFDLVTSSSTGAVRGKVETADGSGRSRQLGSRPAVWIESGGQKYFQTTASDGSFGFGSLAAGHSYPVSAAHPAYTKQDQTIAVTAGQVADAGTMRLDRNANPTTGGIAGLVQDSDGKPIGGALIGVQGSTNFGFTGGDGVYTFVEIPAGKFTVSAQRTDHQPGQVEVNVSVGQMATAVLTLAALGGTTSSDQPPTVTATADPGEVTVGKTVRFAGFVVPNATGATITTYQWDFQGDGTIDRESTSSPNASFVFTAGGTYRAVLKATDSGGRVGQDEVEVRVTSGSVTVGLN